MLIKNKSLRELAKVSLIMLGKVSTAVCSPMGKLDPANLTV